MAIDTSRVELFSLLNFKRLAENTDNHSEMLKDTRILYYTERGLLAADEEVVQTSLRILELLVENPKSCEKVRKGASIKSSLNNVIDRRFGVTSSMKKKAEKIIRSLDSEEVKLSKEKLTWPRKVVTLQVTGLHSGTRKELEDILIRKVKGVLTVIVDVEHQRCTVTLYSHIDPKTLAEAMAETGFFHAHQIIRNKRNQEIMVPLLDEPTPSISNDLPDYLDEEEEIVEPKALRPKDFRVTASEWFLTTAGLLQRSMYW